MQEGILRYKSKERQEWAGIWKKWNVRSRYKPAGPYHEVKNISLKQ